MMKFATIAVSLGLLTFAVVPAHAQTINTKAMEKSTWHNAPREFHIVDERPILKDFRTGATPGQNIQLPPGPQRYAGVRGGGAGNVLPAGGLKLGNGNQGYRTAAPGGPVPLPKADFGHQPSNIPARGLGPQTALPGGYTTNRLGNNKLQSTPPSKPNAVVQRQLNGSKGATSTTATAPRSVAKYGDTYGATAGSSGKSLSTIDVSGKLLKKIN